MENKKIFRIGILLIAIIVIIVLIVVIANWIKNSPIRLVENYLSAAEQGDVDKQEKMIDFAGMYAWEECDEDVDDFYDIYKDVSDNDVEEKLNDWGYENKEDYIKSIIYGDDNISYNISGDPDMEKIGKNMYEVEAKIEIDDDGYEFDETWRFTIYKNKIINMEDID